MNQEFMNFQLENELWNSTPAAAAAAAAAADFRRRSPSRTEEQLLELIWQNGAMAIPVSYPPAFTGVGAADRLFMEEDDDLASWLNHHIDAAESGCDGDKLVLEEVEAMAMAGSNASPSTAAAVRGLTVAGSSETPLRTSASSSVSDERKRKKAMGAEEKQQDAEFGGSSERKINPPQCASVRRMRSADVHNRSERRRRDRINTKMKALQDLIPKCNKSDKASTLDEAIEYVKSLQLQVQMMSMGYNASSLMFPGVHTCLAPIGMGMHMGLGMGMGLGTSTVGANSNLVYPMHQFGPIPPCPAIAGQPSVPLSPRPFLVPFHSSAVPASDQTRVVGINQLNHSANAATITNSSAAQIPFTGDPSNGFPTQQLLSQAQSRVPGEVKTTKETPSQKPTMG